MARRKNKRGSRSSGIAIDGTELKLAGILFQAYNGPATVKKLTSKDLSGAVTEWGKGDVVDVLFKSGTAGFGAMVRRKFGAYVQPIRSKWVKFRM